MKYLEFLLALDLLSKYYPKYHSHELCLLADDAWKWLNNELPEDGSSVAYLKSIFGSPSEAVKAVWIEIQLLSGPFMNVN
jgi:hypothetical protein